MGKTHYALAVVPERRLLMRLYTLTADQGVQVRHTAPNDALLAALALALDPLSLTFPSDTNYIRNDGLLQISKAAYEVGCFLVEDDSRSNFEAQCSSVLEAGGTWITTPAPTTTPDGSP